MWDAVGQTDLPTVCGGRTLAKEAVAHAEDGMERRAGIDEQAETGALTAALEGGGAAFLEEAAASGLG